MRNNILITSAGKRVALVKAFKETLNKHIPEAKVFTTDMNPHMAPAGYVSDGCFSVPRVTNPDYIPILCDICKNNEIGIIVPTIDTELIILSEHKTELEALGVVVIVSDKQFISTCRDKRNTGEFFESHQVRVPRPIDITHPTFPLFAKPYDGSLSKDLHYVASREELTPEIVNNPKLLFMEYIDKAIYKEYTVDMYYGKDHKVKSIVPRERIEIRAGEINKGRTEKGFLVEYLKARFETIPGCIGCICMQLFYRPDNSDIVGIEINPRFGGGYPLSYAAGANYPEFLIQEYLQKEHVEYSEEWKDNLLMLRYDDAIFV